MDSSDKPKEEKQEVLIVEQNEGDDLVTGTEVHAVSDSGIDYDKLVERFGCTKLEKDTLDRFERLTGKKLHRFLRRGIFFCHRDLNVILDAYEKKQPFYLYTGRGPSSEGLHLGHTMPFIFNKYLQDAFDVPLVIQITDDEKYMYRPELELEKVQKMAITNIKDILAFGFDPEKTFIFKDTEYI